MRFADIRHNLKKDFSAFPSVKIAILGDTPTQFLHQALRGCAYDRAVDAIIFEAGIDQIDAQILDPTSDLYRFAPDYVLVFESTCRLRSRFYARPREDKASFAAAHLQHVQALCHALEARLPSHLIYCNCPEIDDGVYGNYANKTQVSFPYQVRALNLGLMDLASATRNLFIADLSSLQNSAGRKNIVSTTLYTVSGFAYALDFWPDMAERVLDIVQSLRGRVHKAVVLDLDNTLWGGIVGDDGLENLQIGDLGIGKAFSELQAWLRQLRQRGVVLAVCSKNYEPIAKAVFETHPDMVLRLDDIAVFVANWENKVDNIRYIQSVLNVTFDSIVYLDDSPFERAMVKEAIPALTVPELPQDPADYLDALASLNLFETGAVSEQDETRTRQYQEEARRTSLQRTYDSEDAFLASLEMVATTSPFDVFQIPRIAQLSQRSNQFNLRTVRYTEQDVERIMRDPGYVSRYFLLEDRIGHHGLISVVVLKRRAGDLFIENWLMSCRVLKRGMEEFVLNAIMQVAAENGYPRVVGEYIPTEKNQLVRDHYLRLGFRREDVLWVIDTEAYVERKPRIEESAQARQTRSGADSPPAMRTEAPPGSARLAAR
jgi:FkbH-like protein